MRLAAIGLLVVLLAAGCGGPAHKPVVLTPVDGEAALGFVKGFALDADGSPRYRIPGTVGQVEGQAFLVQSATLPGWELTVQDFTGADYAKLDRSAVSGYTSPGPYDQPGGRRGCTAAEAAAVPSLPFHNVLAIRRSGDPDRPLVLLGAHWDSQMHSDFDPDPAKRNDPDPGANDGASGVGVLLQLMRELDAQLPDLPFDVGVFFIDGEDGYFDCYPLAGSLYFAQKQPFDVVAFILLDMVGDPGAVFPKESFSRTYAPALLDLLWSHGQVVAPTHFVDRTSGCCSDDHVAMGSAGIPSVDIIDAGRANTFPPQWDTTGDTVDKLDAATLGLVGDVLMHTLADEALPDILADPKGTGQSGP